MNIDRLRATLARDEGCNLRRHDVQGIDHIGYGFNLEVEWEDELLEYLGVEDEDDIQDLTIDQVNYIFDKQITTFHGKTAAIYDGIWEALSPLRKEVLVNLCFNLGPGGLRKFRKMNAAIHSEQWAEAAKHMLDSKAARQTGERYIRLSRALSTNDESHLKLDRLYDQTETKPLSEILGDPVADARSKLPPEIVAMIDAMTSDQLLDLIESLPQYIKQKTNKESS